MNQLFEFFERKFKCNINSKYDIEEILKNYNNLNIAIRHADTFLKDEVQNKHTEIIETLKKYGIVKQTGKIKKI